MTTRSETELIDDSVEPLLEELLAEVVTGARSESKGHNEESITAALTGAAMASFSRAVSQASAVERALLVEALAPALADALAPALAKALSPEIVKALSHLAADPGVAARSGYEESEHAQLTGDEPSAGGAGSGKGKKSRE